MVSLSPSVTEIQARALAAKYGDVSEYSQAVHDWPTEEYQDAWVEALDTERDLLIICPPDTFKSSTVQCWIEKKIGENPNIRILWIMKAGLQAEARVMDVASTIESNPVYGEAFGVEPDKSRKWTNTMLYVKRERDGPDPTLMGCGFNGPYQGFHFDIIIIDDPTNQEDVTSPTVMNAQRNKLRGVIRDRLDGEKRMVGIMTRWGEDDLVPTYKAMGFRIVTFPVMADYPWGPTISPKRFPLEYCQQLRKEKTDAIFDLTYMCDPLAMDGGIIRRSYLKYWSHDPNHRPNVVPIPESGCITLMAVDPASSTKTWADPSAIGTGLLEIKTRTLYITDVWAGKVEIFELERQIKNRAAHTAGLVAIGVETVGFQLTLLQRMKRETRFPFVELPYRSRRNTMVGTKGLDKDKTGRAISIAQMFNANRLYLAEGMDYVEGTSIESELCGFPFAKHDDRLDVIAFLCAMADTYAGRRTTVSFKR